MNRYLKENCQAPSGSKIQKERELLKIITDNARDAIVMMDDKGKVSFWNPAAEAIFGYSAEEALGKNLHRLLAPAEMHGSYMMGIARFFKTGEGKAIGRTLELTSIRKNGANFPLELSLSAILISDKWHAVGLIRDISERKKIEEAMHRINEELEARVIERTAELRRANEDLSSQVQERAKAEKERRMLYLAVEQSPASILITDSDGIIVYVNPKFTQLTGYSSEEITGRNPGMLKAADNISDIYGEMWHIIKAGGEKQGEFCNRKKSGEIHWVWAKIAPVIDISGTVTHFMAMMEDITERKEAEAILNKSKSEIIIRNKLLEDLLKQVEYQAHHDGLTSLPNRSLLNDRIQQAIHLSRRNKQLMAVIFLDLDNFKFINDSMGHDFGDEILKATARRLKLCIRACDTVARQGGDEFVIIISGIAREVHISEIAADIRRKISSPVNIKGHELTITCSLGISVFPKDGDDVQTLIKNADVAMYRAKDMGRDNFQFFSTELNERATQRLKMEAHLRHALERNELSLFYHPKVSLSSGMVTGMEALLRWNSAELGSIPPATFIPLAEETGMIGPIGEWVLKTACLQNKAWQDDGLPPLRMAVNISGQQFSKTDLVGTLCRVLDETGLDPHYLELEITESAVIKNVGTVIDVLNGFRDMGIRLSMDDFGSGYASLQYLKQFPFDNLKIDCSFVRDIISNPDSSAITRTIIAMAHCLHLKVIAEGVETEGQMRYLQHLGCDEMQGYYFSRPMPAGDLLELLKSGLRLESREDAAVARKTVLVVDDDRGTAAALKRTIALDGYQVLTARGAMEGFDLLARNRVGAVISDQWMPGMNGSEFLSRVKEIHPETVRILFSGSGDLESVSTALNKGAIFKYLEKPWEDDYLRAMVAEAMEIYESRNGAG